MLLKKKLIIGNWKMNPLRVVDAVKLVRATKLIAKGSINELGIAVPALFFDAIKKEKPGKLMLGAQDASAMETGAETGGISAAMLGEAGVQFVLVGHSERRAKGETDAQIAEKMKAVLFQKMIPVLCVGEREREHDMWYLHAVKTQLEAGLSLVPKAVFPKLVIAYEPVWAIGKHAIREATVEESREMAIYIRKVLADLAGEKYAKQIKILFGGSVDERNAKLFLEQGGVDGLLVGRASLDPKKFGKIIS